ncbi:MAG: YqaJ viral recombinase family protein [Planctomycetes bacterium]|nr:YqaJ viral recombinase family protein [Planctomycetota bacterium]
MAGNIRLIGRGAAPVLVACMFAWGAAPPPAAAQCEAGKLLASDGAANDQFGGSVSINGDVAVVGAGSDDDNGADSGSAYIFRFDGLSWVQEAKLTASDGAADDFFGLSVAVSGELVVVGAVGDDDNGSLSGSAYMFVKPPGGWVDMTETAKLTAADGAADDRFGGSVSISGEVVVVGTSRDDDNGFNSGSAYVFVKPPGGWVSMTQTAKLTAFDGADNDQFGESVSISGEVIVVGANFDDDNGENSGSAYVYVLSGVDCNRNGQPDACDIFLGVSCDSNANVILDEWEKDNRGVHPRDQLIRSVDVPIMMATLDGTTSTPDFTPAVAEAKNRSEWSWDSIPEHYHAQVQWQLAVTGYEIGYLIVLFAGRHLETFEIEADNDYQTAQILAADEFWKLVEANEPPPTDGADNPLMASLWPSHTEQATEIDADAAIELYEARSADKLASERRNAAEAVIKAVLGEADTAVVGQQVVATWRNNGKGRRFLVKGDALDE